MNKIVYLEIDDVLQPAVVKEIDHPRHSLFHVLFEDGYQNMFFKDVETGQWVEEDLGFTKLAAIFGKSVQHLTQHVLVHKPLTWQKSEDLVFGFFTYAYEGNEVYEIYRPNRKFLCYLLRLPGDTWYLLKTHNAFKCKEVELDLVERISETLTLFYH